MSQWALIIEKKCNDIGMYEYSCTIASKENANILFFFSLQAYWYDRRQSVWIYQILHFFSGFLNTLCYASDY